MFLKHRNLFSVSESQFLWSPLCVKEASVIDWMMSLQTQHFFLRVDRTSYKVQTYPLNPEIVKVTFCLLEAVSVLRWIIRNFISEPN